MPCNSDYMEPTDREREWQHTADLYARAIACTSAPPFPPEMADIVRASEDVYCCVDYVPQLCAFLQGLSDAARDRLLYSKAAARSRWRRSLATWWEEHQAADRAREKEEAALRRREELRNSAKAKLTPEELDALEEGG